MADPAGGAVPRGTASLPLSTRSTIGLWTWALILLVITTIVGTVFAGFNDVLGLASLVAVIALGVGVLMGLSHMRPLERWVIGFLVGWIATFSAVFIFSLIVLSQYAFPIEGISVSVAFAAGVYFGMLAGVACAFGTLAGGFLRGRLAGHVAMA